MECNKKIGTMSLIDVLFIIVKVLYFLLIELYGDVPNGVRNYGIEKLNKVIDELKAVGGNDNV